MKKIIFLPAVVAFFFISCSGSKNLSVPPSEPENYFNSQYALSEQTAKAMIHKFPKHKYGWPRRQKLENAWDAFDPALLKKIINDDNVAGIKFFLAAEINKGDSFRIPGIIIQVKLKEYTNIKGKGAMVENLNTYAQNQYLKASTLCPPPPGDCKLN